MRLLPPPRSFEIDPDGPPLRAGEPKVDRIAGPPQSHTLRWAGPDILIEAADEAAERYARQTLAQLLAQPAPVPAGTIRDEPAFAERGVMLDVSRCRVPTLATLFDLIDRFASLRYNQLQLYTEHTFAYRDHEDVWRRASPYTADDIRRIDARCQERGIELIPNQNSFGHMERWLKHAGYRHLAECPEGYEPPWGGRRAASTLVPGDDSLALLAGLYDELLPCFRSTRFNVGCDETFELGQGASRARCDREGRGRVYLGFLRRIHGLVTERGHSMMFWGDIIHQHPELIPELPRPVTALEWGYEAGHPFDARCAAFGAAGIPFQVCPGTSSWRSVVGRTTNMLANLAEAAAAGRAHGAEGYLVTDWGDLGHLQPWPFSFAGFAVGASRAWNPEAEVDAAACVEAGFGLPEGLGDWLLDIGRVQDLVTSRRFTNASPFFHLLLRREHAAWSPTAMEIAAARPAVDELDERLTGLAVADGWLGRECRLGLGLLRFAIDRGDELPGLIREHAAIWQHRNRPGGLDESAGYLKAELP